MRNFLVAIAALIVLASPAISAETQVPVPAWSWTDCYAGGHAGAVWTQEQWYDRTPGGDFYGQSLGGHHVKLRIGGAQAGCDYQFTGGLVIGVRGDYAWADAQGSHDSAREFGVAYHSKVRSLASATARLGYAWDRLLGYVRAGGAWQREDYSASTILAGTVYAGRETRPGWTIGVGGEYAFNSFLSGFIEYGYHDFGTKKIGLTPLIAGLRPGFVDVKETTNAVRAGLNFRFGGYAAR